jgi:hypothetical protein
LYGAFDQSFGLQSAQPQKAFKKLGEHCCSPSMLGGAFCRAISTAMCAFGGKADMRKKRLNVR